MAICKACGAEIEWVKTKKGKNMPVNPSEFPLIPDKAGNVYGVTADVTKAMKLKSGYMQGFKL